MYSVDWLLLVFSPASCPSLIESSSTEPPLQRCYVGNCTTLADCRREELISECSSRDYDACITTMDQKGRARPELLLELFATVIICLILKTGDYHWVTEVCSNFGGKNYHTLGGGRLKYGENHTFNLGFLDWHLPSLLVFIFLIPIKQSN